MQGSVSRRAGPVGFACRRVISIVHIDIEQLQRLVDEIGVVGLARSPSGVPTACYLRYVQCRPHVPERDAFKEMARLPVGVYEPTTSVTDGLQRIVAYRSLPATSLIIAVSFGKDEILAQWTGGISRFTLRSASDDRCGSKEKA